MTLLVAVLVAGLAAPALGSPEQRKREQLLEKLGLGGTQKKKKEREEQEREEQEREEQEDEGVEPSEPSPEKPDSPPDKGPASPERPVAPASPRTTYTGRIHAMLRSGCLSCHREGGSAGSTRLVLTGDVGHDYRAARSMVDPKRPDTSVLLTKALGQAHGGGAVWSKGSAKHDALRAWIATGAPRGGGATTRPTPAPTTGATPTPEPPSSKPATKPTSRKRPGAPRTSGPGSPDTAAPVDTSTPAAGGSPATTAEPPRVAFTSAAHDQLLARCGSCHREGASGGQTALVLTGDVAHDYDRAVALVDPSAPARSRLLTKAIGVEHGGGPTIQADSEPYRAILAWIENGALGPTAPAPAGLAEPSTDPEAPVPTIDATSGASTPPRARPLGAPPGATGHGLLPGLPFGLRLNGKFDFSYERRDYKDHPFGPGANRFATYHHFLFLSRAGADDPFGFNVELLTQAFYEFSARIAPKGRSYGFLFKAGKILVPFGPEPLFHKSYGGRSGFDQEILPFIWAQPGLAVNAHAQLGPVSLTNDLYTVQGYALRGADAVLNLQGDVSTIDDFHAAVGDRLGLGWSALRGWYSVQINPLGFDRRLFAQAFDLELWRLPDVRVLEDLVLGIGGMRADVSGGGPGRDYYHFGSYATIGYYPVDFLYLQYRAGLRTTDNRRGLYFDPTRLDDRDRGSHNLTVLGRYRGLYGGVQLFWNLERANELDDDFLRITVGYEF